MNSPHCLGSILPHFMKLLRCKIADLNGDHVLCKSAFRPGQNKWPKKHSKGTEAILNFTSVVNVKDILISTISQFLHKGFYHATH